MINTLCIFALAVLNISCDEMVTFLPSSHTEHQSWALSWLYRDHLPLKWWVSGNALSDQGIMGYMYTITVRMKTLQMTPGVF